MYDAVPVQPIVQGLLTVSGADADSPLVPTFFGRGVSAITRAALGVYVLTLDEGLPGNAGEVSALGQAYPVALVPGAGSGASSLTNIPVPHVRCLVTVRGSSGSAVANGTTVGSVTVSYLNTPVISPSQDAAFTQVRLVFQTKGGLAIDPTDTDAAGAEIIIWKDPTQDFTGASVITGVV